MNVVHTIHTMVLLTLQMQTKDLELQMASIKLEDQALLVERADVQTRKMSEAFAHMQNHKSESDKLLASYNERFKECQQSIEKSNEVCWRIMQLAGVHQECKMRKVYAFRHV